MNDLVKQSSGGALTIEEMSSQVNQIQLLMKKVMKKEVHFGAIPGAGDKNVLLKAGAEKIGLMFGCRSSFKIDRTDLPNGHREYEVICSVTDRDGNPVGEGVGTCTTMEKKYRFRAENTGALVPSEYWDSGKDSSILGGKDFVPRKVSGKWMIFQQVEYDNPADYYNTALKMGKKRAYVDAILTCTAASDFFDQEEVIDTPEHFPDHNEGQPKNPASEPRRQPKPKPKPAAKDGKGDGKITSNQLRVLRRAMGDNGLEDKHVCDEFQVESLEDLPAGEINSVLEWVDSASN